MRHGLRRVLHLIQVVNLDLDLGPDAVNVDLVVARGHRFKPHLQPTVPVPAIVAQRNNPTFSVNQEEIDIAIIIIIADRAINPGGKGTWQDV